MRPNKSSFTDITHQAPVVQKLDSAIQPLNNWGQNSITVQTAHLHSATSYDLL